MKPPPLPAFQAATNPEAPAIADDSISLTAVNADDPAEMLSDVPTAELAALEMFAGVPTADLAALASELDPLRAAPGEELMRQGEPALSFLIIASGRTEIRHTRPNNVTTVTEVSPGQIVGEIAMLRHAPRTATVIAIDDLHAYVGSECAFTALLEIPDMAEKLLRMARQRLAALITPVPIRLRDGTELYLRPVLPGDGKRVLTSHVWFSPETHYRRYLSACTPNEALLNYLSDVDYVDHFVWVVTDGVDGPVVADARFVRDEHDPTLAEVAFTVADVYQARGLGTILLGALTVAAHMDGIERLHARVLADNAPARALLDRAHVQWDRDEPGVVNATAAVPDPDDLPVDSLEEIRDTARQVVEDPSTKN